jgi:hypothetical protein
MISTFRSNQRINASFALAYHSFNPTGPEIAHYKRRWDDRFGGMTDKQNTIIAAASVLNAEQ